MSFFILTSFVITICSIVGYKIGKKLGQLLDNYMCSNEDDQGEDNIKNHLDSYIINNYNLNITIPDDKMRNNDEDDNKQNIIDV